jgi:hypothetical protein
MVAEPAIVQLHGGRVLLDMLATAGLPGDRLEWCDPVCCGPTPDGLAPDDWYRVRADYLAARSDGLDAGTIAERLRQRDQAPTWARR